MFIVYANWKVCHTSGIFKKAKSQAKRILLILFIKKTKMSKFSFRFGNILFSKIFMSVLQSSHFKELLLIYIKTRFIWLLEPINNLRQSMIEIPCWPLKLLKCKLGAKVLFLLKDSFYFCYSLLTNFSYQNIQQGIFLRLTRGKKKVKRFFGRDEAGIISWY